jgi:hypothetical protein
VRREDDDAGVDDVAEGAVETRATKRRRVHSQACRSERVATARHKAKGLSNADLITQDDCKKLCVLALAQVALPGCLLVWMFVVRVFGESAASVCVPVPVSVSVPAPCGVRARAAGRAGARGLKADGSWLLRQAAYKVRVRVKKQV